MEVEAKAEGWNFLPRRRIISTGGGFLAKLAGDGKVYFGWKPFFFGESEFFWVNSKVIW